MGKDVIIACDFNSKAEVIAFLEKFKDEKPFVKIGMELFYAEGPDIVRTIKGMGHKIFLDLKRFSRDWMSICAMYMQRERRA